MKEPQKKPASFFRKVAGFFYRFDDDEPKEQLAGNTNQNQHSKPAVAKTPVAPGHDELKTAAAKAQTVANPVHREPKIASVAEKTSTEPINSEAKVSTAPLPEKSDAAIPTIATAVEKPFAESMATKKSLVSEVSGMEAETLVQPRKDLKYPSIVSFRNVYKVFNPGTRNEFTALKNVSFDIEDLPDVGEFIALVGPSGCGKSTVLNLIQGFQEVGPPTLGEVLVRNKPITGPGRDRGMIFQKYSSFPHLTVLQNVMFGLKLNRESLGYSDATMEKLSREMIVKVGMKGHEGKYPYQLSGGQQQRIAIARTLALKPRIILMDEPFSALDEPTRLEMQLLITSLWHEVEATVFIVTHSLAEAVYLSDRIFMFKSNPGRLVKEIAINPADIGKHEGMSPMEVQESRTFTHYLKSITEDFMQIGGSD